MVFVNKELKLVKGINFNISSEVRCILIEGDLGVLWWGLD